MAESSTSATIATETAGSRLPPTTTGTAAASPAPAPAAGPRLLSIDALRGFDMFWIVGGDALGRAILSKIDSPLAERLGTQLTHVEWEGFRFYDLIFPLFMFLVGCVIPYSLSRFQSDPQAAYWRIIRRVALLFFLGLICNGLLRFQFAELRYAGVLQRIAIGYGIAAFLYLILPLRGQIVAVVTILLGYWAVLAWVPVPGGEAGNLTKEGNLAGYLDRLLLPGKILEPYYGFGDNEGLLSTLPAVATVLLGAFTGQWLRSGFSGWQKAGGLFAAGVAGVLLGTAWATQFPIIKNLWTSSFVVLTAGWSLLLLAVFYTLIDVLRWQRWSFFWVVIGVNAITIYIVPRFVDFRYMSKFFFEGVASFSGEWGAVVLLAGAMACQWLLLYYLYRSRIFLRL